MALTAASQVEPSNTTLELRGRRVLLVDDDALLLKTWSRTLSNRGLIVRAVTRISEARDVLALWPKRKFDYALVDDRLPDGFGLDLVPLLTNLRPTPGFTVVSALPSTDRALTAWRNATVIVPKPVSPAGLFELLGFLDAQRKTRRLRYKRNSAVIEAVSFGRFVLDADGLRFDDERVRLTAVARMILAELANNGGAWVPTAQLARALYDIDDEHGTMLVRRQISLLRRALGDQRWLVESALQRGYRLAPEAFSHRPPEPH